MRRGGRDPARGTGTEAKDSTQDRGEDPGEDGADDDGAKERGVMANLRRDFTNLPNLVTMGRVALVPAVIYFIDNFSPLRSFIAALLYLVAAAGDALDGYLARSRGQVSMIGKFLDPVADKLIVTAVLVYMVSVGRVEPLVVVILLARDLAINALRSIASAQGMVIAASDGGKIKTALQLVAIMMLLIYFRYPALGMSVAIDYHRAGRWVLYISTAASLISGAQYMRSFFVAALRQPRPAA
jgi:CDP-diacylglycerol--glycerol-3-phosphate 3-phosphatidyltransferase